METEVVDTRGSEGAEERVVLDLVLSVLRKGAF